MTKPTFTLEEINRAQDEIAQASRSAGAEPAFTLEEINQATDEVAQAEAEAASKQAEADRSD